jgi:ADP-heptose:LPS heptosyltransferase
VAYASQASLRAGVYHPERESLLNCLLRWRGQGRYKMDLAWELARLVGLRYEPSIWRFRLRPEELRAAEQMIHFRKPVKSQMLIGIDPDPGKSGRRFASSNLHYLINHLVERLRAKVMIFQLSEDAPEVERMRRDLRGEVLDMPSQGLRETLALLSRCQLFVAGNTELFHAAVAAGVPSLGLFTEADGARWEPGERAYVHVLRGKAGENLSLKELDGVVERILDAPPA